MKLTKSAILVAGSLYGMTAFAMSAPQTQQVNSIQSAHQHHHGVESKTHIENAPTAESQHTVQPQMVQMSAFSTSSTQAAAVCDVNALATTNSTTLINEIKSQGVQCVNELFSASDNIQATAFDSNNMYAVANHVKTLSQNYQGGGDVNIEALFLYLRAGYFAEFYNDQVTFATWVTPAVKGAIDAFVNNSHFYDDNDAHGKTLSEVIITMDSSEQQDVYLPVITQWLTRWNESYAGKWNMRGAVNGVFTLLFRGQWNNEFKAKVGTATDLVAALRKFTTSTYMINSDAEFMLANAARELGRLKQYAGTAIQSSVDAGLNDIFSRYEMVGYGDVAWLGAADTASYYSDCNDYGICNYGTQLESQVLSQTYTCSSTIKIRSQNMTTEQHQAACSKMGYEEGYFHTKLATNNVPVADDYNAQLQVNIFDSSTDYGKYAGAIFGIDTNNGGMYLEGDPSQPGNIPNFVAYEASYANPDHYVWNLEHEYVHYLDGRFDLYGGFNAPTEAVVWWSEGVAEYVANEDNNQAAIDTIKDGSTYTLGTIFNTTYDGFDQDRIYRWGYLAVRFMFERHLDEVKLMLASTRAGDWAAYKARLNNWAVDYDAEFTQWTQQLANGGGTTNEAPVIVHNGPYTVNIGEQINFSSAGSYDPETSISSFNWDFGDGTSSSLANPVHTYSAAGDYIVTLTATDSEGLSRTESTTAKVLGDTTPNNQLKNAEPKSISGAQDAMLKFTFEVPVGASNLNFALSGGTGDADLYVKFAAEPTMSDFDCRPYLSGNNESCDVSNIQAGTYHVMVYGYNSFETTLTASYTAGSGYNVPDACATSTAITGGRLTEGQVACLAEQGEIWLSLENVSGQNSIAITSANGSGDLSLEYSNQGWPNGSNVEASSSNTGNGECIYLTNQSQYWGYLKVSGNAQGASIVVDYNAPSCR
ncbi:MAG: collagenase [Pseudoalteromonas sp.]|uniref:collagenase n=1 Tax=Pseudoalteromonas phenolica TaxID=161398 RepID=UPI000C09113F|nr:collagenase [Pseudoalteromonas sp.]